MHSFDYDEIVIRLTKRTQCIVDNVTGDDWYQRLKTRSTVCWSWRGCLAVGGWLIAQYQG